MSLYSIENQMHTDMLDAKLTEKGTYRTVLEDSIGDAMYQAIGGSPWSFDANYSLDQLLKVVRLMVAADPVLTSIFSRKVEQAPETAPDNDDSLPF